MAVFAAPVTAGAHADALPAVSTARIWTNVCPGAVTSSEPPAAAAPQVNPSGEVRCSYRAIAPPGSVEPAPTIVTGPTVQAADPPETRGAEGGATSIVQRTFLAADRVRPPTRPLTLTRNVCTPGRRFL